MVGGDFNVGETDPAKSGTNPADEETGTHVLLVGGLVDGLRLRSLSRDMGNTYDDAPGDGVFPYADSGAIDVLDVGGAAEEQFSESRRGSDTFGSDHDPVWTVLAP
ncbi:hypothetical protein [Alienimonas sp. DA493]|uniref:hypothetical protein n=1 Tax=Alienimonas sp. DA493 TaxID=3373605 RepID=UPI0037541AA9